MGRSALIVFAAGAVPLFLTLVFGPRLLIKGLLASRGLSLVYSSADFDPIRWILTFYDVRVTTIHGEIMRGSEMSVDAGITREGPVVDISMNEPVFTIVRDRKGELLIPFRSGGGKLRGKPAPGRQVVRSVTVTGGRLLFRDESTEALLDARNITATMKAGSPYEIDFRSPRSRIVFRDYSLDGAIEAQAVLEDPVRIRSMSLKGGGLLLKMTDQKIPQPLKTLDVSGEVELEPFIRTVAGATAHSAEGAVGFTASLDLPQQSASLRLRSEHIRVASVDLYDCRAETKVTTAGTGSGTASAGVGGGRVRMKVSRTAGKSSVDASLDRVDSRLLPPIAARVPLKAATAASGDLHLRWGRGSFRDVKAEAKMTLTPLKAEPGHVAVGGTVEAVYDDHKLSFAPSELHLGSGGTVQFDGAVGEGAEGLRVTTNVADLHVFLSDMSGQGLGLPTPPASLAGTAQFSGFVEADGKTVRGRVQSPSIRFAGQRFSSFSGSLERSDAGIEVPEFVCEVLGGTLRGHASIGGGKYSLTMSGESIALPELSDYLTGGSVAFTAGGEGLVAEPRIQGQFVADAVATAQTAPESYAGDFALNGRSLEVKARSRTGDLKAAASLDLTEPYPFFTTIDFVRLPVSRVFTRYSGQAGIEATVTGHVEAGFPLSERSSAVFHLSLSDLDVNAAGATLHNQGDISVALTREYVDFERFQVEGGGGELRIAGRLPLTAGQQADLEVDGRVGLEVLDLLLPSLRAGGTIEGKAKLTGVRPMVESTGLFTLRDGSFSHPALPFAIGGIEGEIRLDGADLELRNIRGSLPEGTFAVTGRLPLGSLPTGIGTGAESMDLKIALRSAGTGNVAHLLPEPARSDLHFKADADLRLTGRLGSLSDLSFDGTVSGAGLKYDDWALVAPPFPVSKQGDTFSATGITFTGDGMSLSGSGEIEIGAAARRLRATIRGEVENRVLDSHVSGSEFGGKTTLDLSIDGPPSSPAFSGEVKVAGGSVRVPERRLDLTSISGSIKLSGSRAWADFVGKMNGGETTMAGDATMEGRRIASMVLDASFENCAVFYPEGLQGKMDGRVTFARDREAIYTLDGDLWLRDGLYRKNVSLGRQLLSGLAKKQEKGELPALADMRLNVRVSPVGSVRVKNDVADLRFEGDLTVRGTRGKPTLVGQIRTLPDGKFYFQGRRYAIANGILSFEGDDQLDPRADVRATVDVKYTSPRNPYGSQTKHDAHKISVELLGKISDPTIHLMDDSSSPLSEVEIASLLLTGQVLGSGSTSSKEDYRNQMVRILGGSVGSTFLPVIGRKLGVDQFDIQPADISNETEQPTARAIIGKDLGGGFFFTYSPDLSNSQRYLWILDYQLGHNVALRASRQDDASYMGRVSHNVGFNLFAGRRARPVIRMTGTPSLPDPQKEYIAEIMIEGLKATDAALALRQLTFHPGEELDYERLYASQRKLYSLNVFRSVRVYAEPLPGSKGFVTVRVVLVEQNVYQFFYGLRYNTQGKIAGAENKQNPEGFDGELEVHNVNLFGKGIDAGFYTRQSAPERNYRLTMTLPYLFSHQFNTNILLYRKNLTEEEATKLLTDTRGASLQVEHRLTPRISLRYFSNYKRTRVTEEGAIDHEPVDVAFSRFRLGTAFIGDYRDDPFDAKKGLFASATFEYQPQWLGSDLTLLKSFSQLSLYYTVFNKVTIAVNNRIGLIDNFGRDVPPSDLFYSGGSVSVRSFQEDYLGPRDPIVTDQPWGGRAVIVYNQEIRFPIRALSKRIALKGVLFHDAGNVFREVSELRAFDVRRSAGIGLRLDTPFSLFRLDYAVTIDPRPEENRNRWVFSLGQMF